MILVPRFFRSLLSITLHPAEREEVLGDLEESFFHYAEQAGVPKARMWYRAQVLVSAPRFFVQSFYFSFMMLTNYLKLTLRTLRKQKMSGGINIAGLSAGIALSILILLFVRDELSYDRFHAGHERIVQLQEWRVREGGEVSAGNSNLSAPLANVVSREIPGVESVSRFRAGDIFIRNGEDIFEQSAGFADPDFLSMFSFEMISGSPESALTSINSVVLTESLAQKVFGNLNVVGKTFEVRLATDYVDYTVSGVVTDPPANSTIRFDLLLPIDPWLNASHPDAVDSWGWSLVKTYAKFGHPIDREKVNDALEDVYKSYNGEYQETLRERYKLGDNVQTAGYEAVPISEIYLSRYSDLKYSMILSAIGLVILLIACINFMTMSIGRSLVRSREVGVRKVVGAVRSQLIVQFWGEAMILTLFSASMGILMARWALPIFNDITGKNIAFSLVGDWMVLVGILGIVIVTGIVSGSYPAFVLSAFKPVDVLRSSIRVSGSNLVTKSLVTIQFALSITLIISMLVMQQQMKHIRDRDLGFNTEQVVLVQLNGLDGPATTKHFREKLEKRSEVLGVSVAASALGYKGSSGSAFMWNGKRVNVDMLSVDHQFMDEMGISLVQGRMFDINRAADSSGVVIVNQALVDRFEIDDPIGKVIPGMPAENAPTIIGVTPNFNYQALYQEVGPLMMAIEDYWGFNYMYVRLAPGQTDRSVELLRNTWASVTTDVPFSYEFMDDRLSRVYSRDLRWERIINMASGFAVFLALLGLIGLTSIAVQSRLKEFGIRKVMGASTGQVIALVVRDFVWLILFGSALAIPAAYFLTDKWLANFAFTVQIGPGVYVFAVLLVLGAAMVTIAAQSARAASDSPVKVLKGV